MADTHTPGPWHTETRHTVTAICCKPGRTGEWPDICYQERNGHPEHGSITGRMRTSGELAANARLIAAAPDLLAACRLAMEFFANGTPVHVGSVAHQAIASAVARANGEPVEQWID